MYEGSSACVVVAMVSGHSRNVSEEGQLFGTWQRRVSSDERLTKQAGSFGREARALLLPWRHSPVISKLFASAGRLIRALQTSNTFQQLNVLFALHVPVSFVIRSQYTNLASARRLRKPATSGPKRPNKCTFSQSTSYLNLHCSCGARIQHLTNHHHLYHLDSKSPCTRLLHNRRTS